MLGVDSTNAITQQQQGRHDAEPSQATIAVHLERQQSYECAVAVVCLAAAVTALHQH